MANAPHTVCPRCHERAFIEGTLAITIVLTTRAELVPSGGGTYGGAVQELPGEIEEKVEAEVANGEGEETGWHCSECGEDLTEDEVLVMLGVTHPPIQFIDKGR
jgi:hypothetical protein